MDQLWPETEENLAPYPWHQTSDFDHDLKCAEKLVSLICAKRRKDSRFVDTFHARERTFIRLCDKLSGTKGEDAFNVEDRNFCFQLFGRNEPAEDLGSSTDHDSEEEETDKDPGDEESEDSDDDMDGNCIEGEGI
jgi:hypothetical protein